MIVENKQWDIGPYTVLQRVRFDSPAWAQYLIYRGEKFIGKSFSIPDEDCCRWLEVQRDDEIRYAKESAKLRVYTAIKRGRATNAERAKRVTLELEPEAA